MSAGLTVLIALGTLIAFVLAMGAVWAFGTANRLDRLHVRYDLSWQALDSALARRAVVARAVAADSYGDLAVGRRLVALADAAERAPRAGRETAENELSTALARVDMARLPTPLVAELADAEARVVLARRFHNDAVRDTLALRERPVVRLLRLGGHAPLPTYFEIAERVTNPDTETDEPLLRTSARVVLLDETGAVLLFCGSDPAKECAGPLARGTTPLAEPGRDVAGPGRRWWFTVGGQVLVGERLVQAAVRELAEETGLRVHPDELLGPVWRRDAMIDFNGSVMRSREFFFVHRTTRFEPSAAGRTALERRYIHGHRWCDAADIANLAQGGQTVYPLQLGELLETAQRLTSARQTWVVPAEPQAIR